MVILVKIVKIGQLLMPVESRETYGGHPHKQFPSDHSKMVKKFAAAGGV
jgi:hypothetical protein